LIKFGVSIETKFRNITYLTDAIPTYL